MAHCDPCLYGCSLLVRREFVLDGAAAATASIASPDAKGGRRPQGRHDPARPVSGGSAPVAPDHVCRPERILKRGRQRHGSVASAQPNYRQPDAPSAGPDVAAMPRTASQPARTQARSENGWSGSTPTGIAVGRPGAPAGKTVPARERTLLSQPEDRSLSAGEPAQCGLPSLARRSSRAASGRLPCRHGERRRRERQSAGGRGRLAHGRQRHAAVKSTRGRKIDGSSADQR